jgi:hypothetical protein
VCRERFVPQDVAPGVFDRQDGNVVQDRGDNECGDGSDHDPA